jgi:uncharacterized damage-inducible protein DinB
MDAFFEDYVERLGALLGEVRAALMAVPEGAIDWAPEPDLNSLAVLAAHVAGAARFWAAEVPGELGSGRVRATEFETAAVPVEMLAQRLDEALAAARAVAEGLSPVDLARLVTLPDGAQRTVGWCLLHALEHTALHVGHAQFMVQLWQRNLPYS